MKFEENIMKFEENIMKFEVKLNLKKFDEREYKP